MVDKRLLFLILLLGFLLILWIIERMYKKNVFTPSRVQMPAPLETHQDILVKGKHIRIFPELGDDLWVFFCHGSNGNLSHRQYMVEMCKYSKFNLCLFDYPGYGLSKGSPSPGGLHSASLDVFKWLVETHGVPMEKIVVWGESLGGYPATLIASQHPVRTLVLFSTFSSLSEALTDQLDWWSKIMGNVCRAFLETLPSKNLISKVKCPVVIVHSRNDTVIPYSNAWRLYQAVSHDRKSLIPIAGDHALPEVDPRAQMTLFKILREGCRMDAEELLSLRSQVEQIQDRLRETEFYHQRYLPRKELKKSLADDGFILS